MKVFGDIERVNLETGERFRRVTGDGESRLVSEVEEILRQAQRTVKPIIERERKGEELDAGVLSFVLD